MKAIYLVIIFAFVFSACSPKATPSPSPSVVPPSQTPTSTEVPPTFTPTATPEPIGGGGTILMKVNKLLYPKDISLDKPFNWFSALSDGSNLTAVDYDQIYGFAPDGSRMLVRQANTLVLINPDGTSPTKLDTGPDVFLPTVSYRVLWLTNGKIVFNAAPKESGEKSSIYVVNKDGSGLVKLNQPASEIVGIVGMLFASPDEQSVYWVTGSQCHERGICHEKYFLTRLDDSAQQQVWQNILAASNRIFISPSGKFITYDSDFGWSFKNGCFLATIDGQLISAVALHGYFYCYTGMWSSVEDKLLLEGWVKEKGTYRLDVTVWSEPGNVITKLPAYNAFYCNPVWMPDGERLFLHGCTDKEPWNKSTKYVGSRILNISDGTVTEYPGSNNCYSALSPDSKWAIFFHCQTADSKMAPSQLMNLVTKETHPIFADFVSGDPKALQEAWPLLWTAAAGSVPSASSPSSTPVAPAANTQNLVAGSAKISSKDGRVMVYVPAGEFTMGSDTGQPSSKPAHKVNLDAFWIDQTEVSNGKYYECVQASGCTPPQFMRLTGLQTYEKYSLPDVASLPVVNVSWDQAQTYCASAGGALPTEAQWEKAARGTDGRTYPWGEQLPDYSLFDYFRDKPTQIGSFPDGASPYGALDMAGNVWEYVADWYVRDYYVNSPHDNPTGPATGFAHVIRGGSFASSTTTQITTYNRNFEGSNIGFRCEATP